MTRPLRPGSPEEVGMLPERVAHTRDLCARWVREGHTPTLAVCVARRGVIVLDVRRKARLEAARPERHPPRDAA